MDDMQEMISVVIPYYNRREYIIPTLESVLNQTYRDIEIIIVDDGSEESAEDLLHSYLGDKVRYYRYIPNQGACHARNVGVSLARGDYIAFQDSDDLWLPNKLELELEHLRSNDWDMVFCGMNRKAALGKNTTYFPGNGFDEKKDAVEQLLHSTRVSTQTILLKSEIAQNLQFDESFRKFQDWDYVIQAALKGVKIGYVPKALVNSEVLPDSISNRIKSGLAYEHLYEKYSMEYKMHPIANAKVLENMARCYKATDKEKSAQYLRMSMSEQFTVKRFVKYILTKAGMLK